MRFVLNSVVNLAQKAKKQCRCITETCGCGQIVVLENGKVVEQGPHDVLVGKAGRYAQLWTQQNSSVDMLDAAIKLE